MHKSPWEDVGWMTTLPPVNEGSRVGVDSSAGHEKREVASEMDMAHNGGVR